MRYRHVVPFSSIVAYGPNGEQYPALSSEKPAKLPVEAAKQPVTVIIIALPDGSRIRVAYEFWNRSGVEPGQAWRNYRNNKARRIRELLSDILEGLSYPSTDALKHHLQRQFRGRMSWKNYRILWNIDHLVPAAWFDLRLLVHRKLFNSWANLRPMPVWWNSSRGNQMTLGEVQRFATQTIRLMRREALEYAFDCIELEPDFDIESVPLEECGNKGGQQP